jgi:predicted 3-demethylubiquinone-9 3-methyltransferase (glyoxalase superfamily)
VNCDTQEEIDYYRERLSANQTRATRAMEAMLKMRKIDLQALRDVADGVPAASGS